MRFVFPEINNVFEFKENFINTLVIENRSLLLRLIKDISSSLNGFEGLSVLSKNYSPISIQKNAELIHNFVDFDINNKALITKIISSLEKVSLDEENYLKTQKLMCDIENSISDWAFNFPCDIVSTKITPLSIIKAVGIELRDSYEGIRGEAEKILDYMELVREFENEKLFIILNMRSFFEDEIVETFIKTVLTHGFKVLMIESKSYSLLKNEKRFTVDEDLCEF